MPRASSSFNALGPRLVMTLLQWPRLAAVETNPSPAPLDGEGYGKCSMHQGVDCSPHRRVIILAMGVMTDPQRDPMHTMRRGRPTPASPKRPANLSSVPPKSTDRAARVIGQSAVAAQVMLLCAPRGAARRKTRAVHNLKIDKCLQANRR
jgi:hypothetical protein